jgi:hypothetical protein
VPKPYRRVSSRTDAAEPTTSQHGTLARRYTYTTLPAPGAHGCLLVARESGVCALAIANRFDIV